MSAAFLGGLGNFATSFMRGYEQAEDREAMLKQRQFEESQRQRKLDEQRRADELRTADASVLTTEEVEVPGTKTIYGKEAPVVRDDDGNLMPGAVETPATTVKRQRSWDAIMRDYAANRQKVGDVAGALEYEQKAQKLGFERSAREFSQWSSGVAGMSLDKAAEGFAKIYSGDPFGGRVQNIRKNADGSVTMELVNKDGGPNHEATFKSVAEMVNMGRAYYQPETFAKLQEAQQKAAIERQAELYKPRVLKPGETLQVYNPETNKMVTVAEGNIPKGYEVVTGPNGEQLLRPFDKTGGGSGSGSGTGKGGKASDPLSAVSDRVFEIIKESAAKGALEPGQVARANTLGRQLVATALSEGRNIDEGVASEIAIGVATGKTPVTPAFNPRTGTIDNVVEYQGSKFAVENLGKPGSARMDNKQLSAVATNYIASLPEDQRAQVVAAAYNQEALGKLNASLEQRARSPEAIAALEQRLGRKATEDDINKAVKATQDAVRPSLELISRYATLSDEGKKLTIGLAKQAGYTSDFKGMAPPQPSGKSNTDAKGMGTNKFAGLTGAALKKALDEDQAQMIQANRGNFERLQKARSQAAADPELIELDRKRAKALRDGNAVEANNIIAQFNKIKKERYGL